MSTPANSIEVPIEEQLNRLRIGLAAIATDLDLEHDARVYGEERIRMSAEEVIERVLYPEHFV